MPRVQRLMQLDEALEAVGGKGPYLYRLFGCLFIVGIFHGARMTSGYFFLYEQEHSCSSLNPTLINVSDTLGVTWFSRVRGEKEEKGKGEQGEETHDPSCLVGKASCKSWDFNTTVMKQNAVSKYDLVCSNSVYKSHANTALMVGSMIGSTVFGKVSDKYGRKVSFHLCVLLLAVFGVATPWPDSYWAFIILYAISGAASTGMFAAALVTAMEYVKPKQRKIPGLMINVFFPIGELVLAGVAFGLRDWRWISIVIAAPVAIFLSYFWFIPESIQWLMLHKKYQKLDEILRKMATFNGRQLPPQVEDEEDGFGELLRSIRQDEPEDDDEIRELQKDSFVDMFKSCKLASWVIFTCFNWVAVNLVYFGLVFYSANLGQGLYMNFFYGSFVEIPAHFISLFSVDRVGRKRIHCFYFLLVALTTAVSIIVSFKVEDNKLILLLMTMIGKFAGAGLLGTSFLWMTEIYPTSVRSMGLGVGAACARVGAIISAYVVHFGDTLTSDLGKAMPYIVFCVCAVLAFGACLTLPETSNRELPNTIREALTVGAIEEEAKKPLLQPGDEQGGYGAFVNGD